MTENSANYRVHTPAGMRSKWVTASVIAVMHRDGKIPDDSWVTDVSNDQRWPISEFVHKFTSENRSTQSTNGLPDPIPFTCPHCRAKLRGKASHVGRRLPCPMCKLPNTIPSTVDGSTTEAIDPDVYRQITYCALKAVRLMQDALFSDRELAAIYNGIFFILPRPDQIEWVSDKIARRTHLAWEICSEVWQIIDRAGPQHKQCWWACMSAMKIIDPGPRSVFPDNWRDLRGIAFEQFLCTPLQKLGFKVQSTPTTGDQGVDLIVSKPGFRLAVQAKGYAGTVGNDAVQQVFAGMQYYDCDCCAVLTNSRFTPQARELAKKLRCILVGESDLLDFLSGDIQVEELLEQMNC